MEQPFAVLEQRIIQMIEQMKTLRSECVRLQSVVDEQVKIGKKQNEERQRVRRRIGHILETLNHVADKRGVKGDNGSKSSDV